MLRSIGVLTVSTNRVVMVILRSHRYSRWSDTFVPCTPILAIVPPGATIFSHEGDRDAHRLDSGVNPGLASHPHDRLRGFSVGAVYGRGGAQALRHFETMVVEIDH